MSEAANPNQSPASAPAPVIIDLGKQSKKKVNRLRRGDGVLMSEIEIAIEELRAEGVIEENAQPVIVVVQRKQKTKLWMI